MKTLLTATLFQATLLALLLPPPAGIRPQDRDAGYVLEREKDIGIEQPGLHDGGGMTTGYSFFSKAPRVKLGFRKRVLHPSSSIGYHLQEIDEICYLMLRITLKTLFRFPESRH